MFYMCVGVCVGVKRIAFSEITIFFLKWPLPVFRINDGVKVFGSTHDNSLSINPKIDIRCLHLNIPERFR